MGSVCGKGAAQAVETADAPTSRPPAITTESKPASAAEQPVELQSPESASGNDEKTEDEPARKAPPSPLENAGKPLAEEQPKVESPGQAAAEAPAAEAPVEEEEKGDKAEEGETKAEESAPTEKPELVEVELTEEMRAKAVNSFERSDANKDGKVTVDELSNLLNDAGKNASPEDVLAFIAYFDLKKKSYLDLDDFLEIMKYKVSDQPAGQTSEPPQQHSRMTSFLSFLLSTPVPSKEQKPEETGLDDVEDDIDSPAETPKEADPEVSADPDRPPGPVRRTGSLTPSFLLQMKEPSAEATSPKESAPVDSSKPTEKDAAGAAAAEADPAAESGPAPSLSHVPKRKSFVERLLSPFSGEAREEGEGEGEEAPTATPAPEPAPEPVAASPGVTQ